MTKLLVATVLCLALAPAARGETCRASWYGAESGRTTANGERFRPDGFSIALRSRPRGELYRVTYHGRSVIVRHNDFGPAPWTGRCADLSRGAARALGFEGAGTALVTIERQ